MNKFQTLLIRVSLVLLIVGFLANTTFIPTYASSLPAPRQSSSTFTPRVDAYVNASSPATNYGTSTALHVDASPLTNSFLRFTVNGLGGSSITRARLRVYANSSSSQGLVVKAVANKTWGETTITYSNMPTIGKSLASSASVSAATWITFDVTSYITGEGTFSFALTTPGSTSINLASRESGAHAPQLIVSFGTSATATVAPPTRTPTRSPVPIPAGAIKHVFVVVMENHSYNQVWNTSSSPYITNLGKTYARATNYHAITHPSLPNYLNLYAGSNHGITDDCSPSSSCHINAVNLADNLQAKGLTWKGYMESMPSACYQTPSGNYAPRHNPFVYFDDIRNNTARCQSHVVPYTALASDLASVTKTPNYALIVPNLCNDTHDCSISTGDTWLKNHLPTILNSPACTIEKCLLILTWDEDNSSQGNQVLTIFAGSAAKTGGVVSSVPYTHFSLLRTIENIFGLPTQTNNDAAAKPMNDLLR